MDWFLYDKDLVMKELINYIPLESSQNRRLSDDFRGSINLLIR